MFQFGLVLTINNPTIVKNKTVSAIDHRITNSIFKTAIIRTDLITFQSHTFSNLEVL